MISYKIMNMKNAEKFFQKPCNLKKLVGGVETKKKDLNLFFYKYKNMKRLILKI